jgi:hypothetical protein
MRRRFLGVADHRGRLPVKASWAHSMRHQDFIPDKLGDYFFQSQIHNRADADAGYQHGFSYGT